MYLSRFRASLLLPVYSNALVWTSRCTIPIVVLATCRRDFSFSSWVSCVYEVTNPYWVHLLKQLDAMIVPCRLGILLSVRISEEF